MGVETSIDPRPPTPTRPHNEGRGNVGFPAEPKKCRYQWSDGWNGGGNVNRPSPPHPDPPPQRGEGENFSDRSEGVWMPVDSLPDPVAARPASDRKAAGLGRSGRVIG